VLKTTITHKGQEYLDEPVRYRPKMINGNITMLMGNNFPQIVNQISHYQRVTLDWRKPCGNITSQQTQGKGNG